MFRFTIRDVLWLTALVAMGVGWWVDRQHQEAAEREFRSEVNAIIARETYLREVINVAPE